MGKCRGGEIGRRARFKIWWWKHRVGSSPTLGTLNDLWRQIMITDIFATTSSPANAPASGISSFVTIGLMFAVFYFLMIRPQKKRQQAHESLLKNLNVGDEVATTSGIIGTILSLDQQYLELSINENSTIKMQRHAVSQVFPKGSTATATTK